MQDKGIQSFLSASAYVLETMMRISPSTGTVGRQPLLFPDDHIGLAIGIRGKMRGGVVFDFPKTTALGIVSGMMGGFPVTGFDDMAKSAIAELGNMISGNASIRLSEMGILIDITTPRFIENGRMEPEADLLLAAGEPHCAELSPEGLGAFRLFVDLRSDS